MRITVLTSSRADFGIQIPLLRALDTDPDVQLSIIAFGSHADARYGHTLDEITAQGFSPARVLPPVLDGDDPAGIATAMGRTMEQFAAVWPTHRTDMLVALGDRYEMFAAVASALPFGLPVTHLHGGETTLGAMDNALRHGITHMAQVHCTCTDAYRDRVVQLLGHDRHVHNTGALSMDNLRSLELLDTATLHERYGVDLALPTVLVTFHPETATKEDHVSQWEAFSKALRSIGERYRVLITLPNADTQGMWMRQRWAEFLHDAPFATAVDSLGAQGYLSCMKHCAFMLGNTSSGYVEASWFPKWVIDVGERQTGRLVTPNIMRCPIRTADILQAVEQVRERSIPNFIPPYGDGHAAERIVAAIKRYV